MTGLDQKELDDDVPCFLLAQSARGMDANNFSAPVPPPPITAEELLHAQGADGRCQQLRAVIDSGKPTRFVLDEEGRLVRRQPTTDVMLVVAVGGPTAGRGAAPQLWTAHPRGRPQNIPIRASKGMTCPNLREIGSGRGRGFSLVVFPTPLLLV